MRWPAGLRTKRSIFGHVVRHELPDDVLRELGRVAWAAILLEDYTDGACHTIRPRDPRVDSPPIGRKVVDAIKTVDSWRDQDAAERARAWLTRADAALTRRNSLLHAVPLVTGPADGGTRGYALGEMPRAAKGLRPEREYIERSLDAAELAAIAEVLEDALDDWIEVVMTAGAIRRTTTN